MGIKINKELMSLVLKVKKWDKEKNHALPWEERHKIKHGLDFMKGIMTCMKKKSRVHINLVL